MVLFKILWGIFGTGLIFLMSILVMMKGWGIEPQSWPWIIGGYLVITFFGLLGGILAEF